MNSYFRGGNCSDCRLHSLCCCQLNDQHYTPDKAVGALGLVAVGALVDVVVGVNLCLRKIADNSMSVPVFETQEHFFDMYPKK